MLALLAVDAPKVLTLDGRPAASRGLQLFDMLDEPWQAFLAEHPELEESQLPVGSAD